MPEVKYKQGTGFFTKATKSSLPVSPEILQNYTTQLRNSFSSNHPKFKYLKTVVVAVVEIDGYQFAVYTVNQNLTSHDVRETAQKLGIERWTYVPRTKGRGSVGAPMDAEQILIEAADAQQAKVLVAAPSNSACADCKLLLKEEGIIIVEPSKSTSSEVDVETMQTRNNSRATDDPKTKEKKAQQPVGSKAKVRKSRMTKSADSEPKSTRGNLKQKSNGFTSLDDTVEGVAKRVKREAVEDAAGQIADSAKRQIVDGASGQAVRSVESGVVQEAVKNSTKIKLSPKIKFVGGLVLDIAYGILVSWLDQRRFKELLAKDLIDKQAMIEDTLRSAHTESLMEIYRIDADRGYQLYLKIDLIVKRTWSDGGASFSGQFTSVTIKSSSVSLYESEFIYPTPTGDESEGWEYDVARGSIYNPLFPKHSYKIHYATVDAATGNTQFFSDAFISKFKDFTPEYFYEFEKYCLLFPKSTAGHFFKDYQNKNEGLDYLVTLVEIGKVSPNILLNPFWGLSFEAILFRIRWKYVSELLFIKDYYEHVIKLDYVSQLYFLEKYDKYFQRLDDEYTKCQSSCHRALGDKRIIHRIEAANIRQRQIKPGASDFFSKSSEINKPSRRLIILK